MTIRFAHADERLCGADLIEPPAGDPAIAVRRAQPGGEQNELRAENTDLRAALREARRQLSVERNAREDAERLSQMKDRFLASVSHELRSPMAALLLWEKVLTAPSSDEVRKARALEAIRESARTQAKIIDDLLDVSRGISGKLRVDQQPTEVAPVLARAVEAARPFVEAKGVSLEVSSEASLGLVRGDAARLEQVVTNLLSNAIQFTFRGGRIEVRASRAGESVEISVRDDGKGIAPVFLPQVFEPFVQAESSLSPKAGGLGLGLSISKQLVTLHGGTIRAESPGIGEGSTFTVTLPLLDESVAREASRR